MLIPPKDNCIKYLLFGFFLLFISCKKDIDPDIPDNHDGYYMYYKGDDVEYKYGKDGALFAGGVDLMKEVKEDRGLLGSAYATGIFGYPHGPYPGVSIRIYSTDPFSQTSYKTDNVKVYVSFGLTIPANVVGGSIRYGAEKDIHVSITSLGTNTVKGTFSGTIDAGTKTMTIKNGRFYLPRVNL